MTQTSSRFLQDYFKTIVRLTQFNWASTQLNINSNSELGTIQLKLVPIYKKMLIKISYNFWQNLTISHFNQYQPLGRLFQLPFKSTKFTQAFQFETFCMVDGVPCQLVIIISQSSLDAVRVGAELGNSTETHRKSNGKTWA